MPRKLQNRSVQQIERIKKRIECMRTVVEMLQYIVGHPEESERKIVSEFGIEYRQYRKYAYDENWMTDDPETVWNRSEDIMKQQSMVPLSMQCCLTACCLSITIGLHGPKLIKRPEFNDHKGGKLWQENRLIANI